MNLLMISGDRSIARGKRGAFYYTLEEFSKQWDRIDILCPFVENPVPSPFPNVFVHVCPVGLLGQPAWIEKQGKELIAKHGHCIATVHEFPPFYNGRGAGRFSAKTGIPYVLEIHHVVGYPKPASFTERMGRFLSRIYLKKDARRAAAVRVVNGETGRLLASFGISPDKIHIVPSFYLDAKAFHPDLTTRKIFDLIFCARLVANKGLLALLEALTHVSATLLIIGEGPQRVLAERYIASHGLQSRVTFTGWLEHQEEVAARIRLGRVFVMNSLSEGGPRVALEAMAAGLPVIATKVGVMPDVIKDGENGFFTDGTAKDLAQKITFALADEKRLRNIGEAASHIIDRFERRQLIKDYADFLKKFAERR